MEWSLSKIIRIETGSVGISITDLRALLQHYGVTDAVQHDELVALARAAKVRPWWDQYKGLASAPFLLSLGYESAAAIIRNHEPIVIPGLLQTEEYAKHLLTLATPEDQLATIPPRLELRLERQERLLQAGGPELHFIFDESAIMRAVGGPDLMRRQVRRLQELSEHPRVTMRILPLTAGYPLPNYGVAYVLYEFTDPEEDVVLYLENPEGEVVVREGQDWDASVSPASYLESFYGLEQSARRGDVAQFLTSAHARHSVLAEDAANRRRREIDVTSGLNEADAEP